MAKNDEWEARVKSILKAELKQKGVTYNQLGLGPINRIHNAARM